ncbi:DUF2726 domain-containing protein, partial [Lysinibacillus sp. CNPSo 3705]|uniref:DUF2726 domain-containing protein n=1 Tax=Lysinibacillus sp. CNPSo 3705 TaxID=3028148 RepID=UPI00236469CD
SSSEKKEYINENLTFETAFVVKRFGDTNLAKTLYTVLLAKDNENVAVLNNLAVIYIYEKQYETALELLLKGEKLDPNDKHINNNLNDVRKAIEELKQRPKRMKDYYFKKTDKLQKQILFTIYKLLDAPDFSMTLIKETIKINDTHFFNKKLNPLLENGLIEEHNGEIKFDATIQELVESWVDPKIERQVIKANKNKFYRPIFYHESEINLYRVLIETFPQHLVFPNMDLKAIIDLDKVKEFLSNDEMSYLFKAHVDFAIINTTTYFPIICFEKDSDYNDSKRAEQNGIVKNHIFETSGLPLIRVRYNAAMDYERLKEEIKTTTKQFLLDTQSEYPESNLLSEFDLKRFGIYDSSIDEVELKTFWNEIVGEIIAQSTLEFSFNKEQMLLSITLNKQAEMIISIGLDSIKTKIYNRYPQLNQINFYYE